MNFFSSKPSSKDIANERLKLILIHDRTDLSLELLEIIKSEILDVINKYVEIDVSEVEVKFAVNGINGNKYSVLVANMPIKKGHTSIIGK